MVYTYRSTLRFTFYAINGALKFPRWRQYRTRSAQKYNTSSTQLLYLLDNTTVLVYGSAYRWRTTKHLRIRLYDDNVQNDTDNRQQTAVLPYNRQ